MSHDSYEHQIPVPNDFHMTWNKVHVLDMHNEFCALLPCLSTILTKESNYRDFLFASVDDITLLLSAIGLKDRISLCFN